ncbi:hypothetical protein HanPI659440_Chr08g0305811 [Helianthus annuus]|nr:hypothetical protein HanPI659440_Chr08g0305811 [Helianthus annuus]
MSVMIFFLIHPKILTSKMSNSENSSERSDSSSEYNEWEAQVFQEDQQLDAIMCRLLINMPDTSRRRYSYREREQGEARLILPRKKIFISFSLFESHCPSFPLSLSLS